MFKTWDLGCQGRALKMDLQALGLHAISAFSSTPCEVLSPHTPTMVDNEAPAAMPSYHSRLYPLSWDPKQTSPPLMSL